MLLLLISTIKLLHAATVLQVDGGPGSASRIQSAVDACIASEPCTILLPDPVYQMENQVWVKDRKDVGFVGTASARPVLKWEDSLLQAGDTSGTAKLFMTAAPTGGGRPILPAGWLRWPFAKDYFGQIVDTMPPYTNTGYVRNGMFLVENSKRVVFRHLSLDGQKPAILVNRRMMTNGMDILHGSVGIALLSSLAAEVVDCDIRRFWTGVYMSSPNPACQYWAAPTDPKAPKPWTACGTMGGHLVEHNRIHDNFWAVYSSWEWDQGSVLRENLGWNNLNQGRAHPLECVTPNGWTSSQAIANTEGGFLGVSDVFSAVHAVTHNTLLNNSYPYYTSGYRVQKNAFWSDNIVDVIDSTSRVWRHIFENSPYDPLWYSTVLHHSEAITTTETARIVSDSTIVQRLGISTIEQDTVMIDSEGTPTRRILPDTIWFTNPCTKGCQVILDSPSTRIRYWNHDVWNAMPITGRYWFASGRLGQYSRISQYLWDPNWLDSASRFSLVARDTLAGRLRGTWMCRNCPFQSNDTASPAFLIPDWNARWVDSSIARNGSFRHPTGAMGRDGILGSQAPIRLRATGMPYWSKLDKLLHLPLSMRWSGAGPQKLFVRQLNSFAFLPDTNNLANTNTPITTTAFKVNALNPGDTEIVIPFAAPNTDQFYQFEFWIGGVRGTDTLPATPVAWVWNPKASGGVFQTARVASETSSAAAWRVGFRADSRSVFIPGANSMTKIVFVDPRGRQARPVGIPVADGLRFDLGNLPTGLWLAVVDRSAFPILIGR